MFNLASIIVFDAANTKLNYLLDEEVMTDGLSLYLPFFVFLTVMVATPGPANLLLINAGAAHGFRTNIPFFGGLILGKIFLNTFI